MMALGVSLRMLRLLNFGNCGGSTSHHMIDGDNPSFECHKYVDRQVVDD